MIFPLFFPNSHNTYLPYYEIENVYLFLHRDLSQKNVGTSFIASRISTYRSVHDEIRPVPLI